MAGPESSASATRATVSSSASSARARRATRPGASIGSARSAPTDRADPTRQPGAHHPVTASVRPAEAGSARSAPTDGGDPARVRPFAQRRPGVIATDAGPGVRFPRHDEPKNRGGDVQVDPRIEQILRSQPEHGTPDRIVDLRHADIRAPAGRPDQGHRLGTGLGIQGPPRMLSAQGMSAALDPHDGREQLRGDAGPASPPHR